MGGINLVDVSPFGGNFSGVVVANNVIAGGFSSEVAEGSKMKGANEHNALIKYVCPYYIPDSLMRIDAELVSRLALAFGSETGIIITSAPVEG